MTLTMRHRLPEEGTLPLKLRVSPVPRYWAHSHSQGIEEKAGDLSLVRRGRGLNHSLNCNMRRTLMNQESIDFSNEI